MRPGDSGFGLTEVVISVSVLSILAAVMVPVVSGLVEDARVETATEDLAAIRKAYLLFHADTGHWPGERGPWNGDDQAFVLDADDYALFSNADGLAGWKGPYLSTGAVGQDGHNAAFTNAAGNAGLVDPWGRPYAALCVAAGKLAEAPFGALAVYSLGPNGTSDSSQVDLALGRNRLDDVVEVVSLKP